MRRRNCSGRRSNRGKIRKKGSRKRRRGKAVDVTGEGYVETGAATGVGH